MRVYRAKQQKRFTLSLKSFKLHISNDPYCYILSIPHASCINYEHRAHCCTYISVKLLFWWLRVYIWKWLNKISSIAFALSFSACTINTRINVYIKCCFWMQNRYVRFVSVNEKTICPWYSLNWIWRRITKHTA